MDNRLYDLTNSQKSIWFTEQFYKGTSIENITGSVTISEKVNFKALKEAINLFVKKNDSFRLKFTIKEDKPMQYVEGFSNFDVETISISSTKEIETIEKKLCNTPFDVLNSLLFVFKIFKLPNDNGGFVICAHHLIADAWTAGLVVNEIMGYYSQIINKEKIEDEINPSYIDYIVSEQEYLNSEKFENDKTFWNENFSSVPQVATIPSINSDLENTSELACSAKRKQFVIPKETISLINAFCKENKASAFNFFIGVFSIYISRVSSLDDFVIGTPILNRGNFKEKQTAGMYISTVPFRISIDNEGSFANFISKIASDFSQIFRHQKYPYQYLLESLRKQDNSIPNLYNIMLSYQNAKSDKQSSEIPYDSRWVANSNISDDIDIHLYDMNDTGNINIAYDYLINKYSIDDICSIHARILHIINQILENNEINLKDIEIVTPDEKHKILYEFNNTKVDYPKGKTIAQLFEEQVEKTPDNIAVVFEDQKLTYKELNEKSNSLANYLRDKGIGRNDIVGIMVNRSLEMIVGIMAVLKSGGCYIPIDPEYPQDRIEYMLKNSEAKLLLTFEKLNNKVNFNNKIFIELSNNIYDRKVKNLENINDSEDLAYVIYTSGSTGLPKGVMLKHNNINNFIKGTTDIIDFNQNKTIVSVTTISFDIFVLETLLPLQKGLKIIIANENEQTNVKLFNELCVKNNVNIIQTTPSRFQALISDKKELEYIQNLTDILIGGESFPSVLLEKLCNISKANIFNMYGPTETAVWSTIKNLTNETKITIGKPIANTYCYILDKNKNILPPLVPGNLYIGGEGVAKGYFKKEDLTNEKFISNPCVDNQIIYDTGDLAYFNGSDELIHLGRTDFQVKIRGYRIELGEIERNISSFKNIIACVVSAMSLNNSENFLVAYYTSKENINTKSLRKYLKDTLPTYMIPQYFVELKELPYTPNGKIDRKKLPMPEESVNKEIVLPRNDMDSELIEILKDLLDISSISIEDSFFELGGDSLAAINLSTKSYNKFNVEIFVKDILENPVVKDLSDLISSKNEIENINVIKKAKKAGYYTTSAAQKRMYYASLIGGENSTLYNIAGGLLLDQIPDMKKLENCFNSLINRHEALRTSFEVIKDEVVQKIQDNIEYKLDLEEGLLKDKQKLFYTFSQTFDLSQAPLFRTKLIKFEDNSALLLVDMHHIISDRYFLINFNK